jgi:SynChlorMet cassette protein ScmD
MMTDGSRPVANPLVVLREEFDDWAVLFDPDTGEGYGLNPVSVFIWKRLDGRHTVADIVAELRKHCADVPDDAEEYVAAYVQDLLERGLAGHELHPA